MAPHAPQFGAGPVRQHQLSALKLDQKPVQDDDALDIKIALVGRTVMQQCFRYRDIEALRKIAGAIAGSRVRMRVIKTVALMLPKIRLSRLVTGDPEQDSGVDADNSECVR